LYKYDYNQQFISNCLCVFLFLHIMDQLDINSNKYVISLLQNMLAHNDKFSAIKLLRKLKYEHSLDITHFIDQVLHLGDIVFYRFVKMESRDIINSFNTFDKILHTIEPNVIIDLLEFDIIEPEYSAQVNNVSLDKVIYIIIQFSEYDENVKQYLFNKYYQHISNEGLLHHMIFYNVCNDIFVYVRACMQNNKYTQEFINFDKVLASYQTMYDKYKDNEDFNICLRSRLIGAVKQINNICLDKLLDMPDYKTYKEKFESYYNINEKEDTSITTSVTKLHTIYTLDKSDTSTPIKDILDKLCYDSYEYINNNVPWGSQRIN
jgi:hypothetical protein